MGTQQQGEITVRLSHPYSNLSSVSADEVERILTLQYFICDRGQVVTLSPDLTDQGGLFRLHRGDLTATSKIYVVANGHLSPGTKDIAVGSAESLLTSLQTMQSDNNGQVKELAMSLVSPLSEALSGDKALKLQLRRNMARFDLKIQQDVGIEVLAIRVRGLPMASSVFMDELSNPESEATYVSDFKQPITRSTPRLFYGHPLVADSRAAVVQVDVKYNGRSMTLERPLSQIKRNYIHNISVASNLGAITLDVSPLGLDDGDTDSPIQEELTLKIDRAQSQLCDGASISDDAMRLHMPYWGGECRITLSAAVGVVLKEVRGLTDDFAITSISPDGLSYRITTSGNQRSNGQKRAVMLNFSHPSDALDNDFPLAVVIDNSAAFPFVSIGDLDWMHYNAVGSDPNLYQQPIEMSDVRSLYSKGTWAIFTGKTYQWGPRPGRNGVQVALVTWGTDGYGNAALPSVNGAIIGDPGLWQGGNVPCPAGWRIPRYDEFKRIWPPQGTLLKFDEPTQYTVGGKNYSAVIETFGGSYQSNISGSGQVGGTWDPARNIIIGDGQTEILFPIGGYRKPNGTFKPTPSSPNSYNGLGLDVGVEAWYWCADRLGLSFKYIAVGIANKVIQNNTNDKEHNAWYSVRCVRDKK